MKRAVVVALCLILGVFADTSFATDVTLFGPHQYIRTSGSPDVFTDAFTAVPGEGMLIVKNGSMDGNNRITDAISSASVYVNGQQIFGPSDFNQNVYILQSPVNLTENNAITVELASGPGSYLTIEIKQDQQQNQPTVTLSADPGNIMIGESATLTWNSSNADTCEIDQGVGSVNVNGSISVSPTQTTTYTITATGADDTATDSVTVTVTYPAPTVSISAAPETILLGESATLTWNSTEADSAVIDQGIGTVATNGSVTVSPTETTTYTISVTGPGGTATANVTVAVTYPPPTVSISAVPETILLGESATLTWSSTNADSAVIDQGIGSVSSNGSVTVSPAETTTYTITVTGPGGTATANVTVTVTYPPPTVSISADPETIQSGESSTLTWSSTNANSVVIDQGIGTVATNGSVTVSPIETTTYTITVTGPGGTATADVTVNVSTIGISITSPLDGVTLSRPDTLVQGTIINPLGNEVGVTINGIVAMVYGNQFVANHVPLEEGENIITVIGTDSQGYTTTAEITVYAQTAGGHIIITADTESGVSPFEAILQVEGAFNFLQEPVVTPIGPDVVDPLESLGDGQYSVGMSTPGIYYFTAEVTDDQSNTYTDTIAVVVLDQTQLDALLKAKWDSMRQALIDGDVDSAAAYFKSDRKTAYYELFQAIPNEQINNVIPGTDKMKWVEATEGKARYATKINIVIDGVPMAAGSYIIFTKDVDGLWKIGFF